jgi:hypothetical protein
VHRQSAPLFPAFTRITISLNKGAFVRLFADVLRDMRAGQTHDELSEALHALVRQCCETGRGGELTYTLTIKPTKSAEAVEITDKIGLKEPRNERGSSLFFVTATFDLTRNNPRQQPLDLREVPPLEAPRELRPGGTP